MERLHDVVVRSLGEAAYAVGLGAAAGEDDHRQRRVVTAGGAQRGPNLAQDVEPRGVRQAEVEEQEVAFALFVRPDPLR